MNKIERDAQDMGLTARQFLRYREVMRRRTLPSLSADRCVCGAALTCPMLREEVWLEISNGARFLCWACAEKRLRREIKIDDLGACYQALAEKQRIKKPLFRGPVCPSEGK